MALTRLVKKYDPIFVKREDKRYFQDATEEDETIGHGYFIR